MTRPTDRPTVLLVDDCVVERDLYELVLTPEFRVMTAARGEDALAVAAAAPPDVVLLDVRMPGIDGWDTCSRLKTNPLTADVPVVMLTGVDDSDLSARAAAVGAYDVMSKPCPAERLFASIHAAMGERSRDGGRAPSR